MLAGIVKIGPRKLSSDLCNSLPQGHYGQNEHRQDRADHTDGPQRMVAPLEAQAHGVHDE